VTWCLCSRRPSLALTLALSLAQVRTGDLVLMQSEAFTARFVTHALRCEYAHLAIYLLLTTYDLLLTTYYLLLTTYY
jgi:hypothetical protein